MTLRYDAMLPDRQLPVHSVAVKQERVRVVHLQGYRQPSVLLDLASGEIVKLDPRNRSYFKTDIEYGTSFIASRPAIAPRVPVARSRLLPRRRANSRVSTFFR